MGLDPGGQAAQSAAQSAAQNNVRTSSKPSAPYVPPPQPAVSAPATGGGSSMCFVAGTMVQTPGGQRKIEDLKVGDEVFSCDQETGSVEPAVVLHTWKSQRADLITLATADGSVTCSQNHRFYTADHGWLPANQLQPGEIIMARDSSHLGRLRRAAARTVTAVNLEAPVNVYNLTVANNSDYFVGPDAILCHNNK